MNSLLHRYMFLLMLFIVFPGPAKGINISSAKDLTRTQIERFLKTADVILIEDIHQGITKPKRVTLQQGNITLRAIFKTYTTQIKYRKGFSQTALINRADRYQYELAAYRLDQMLDLNMVPITVSRRYKNQWGIFQLWVENSVVLKSIYERDSHELEQCNYKQQHAYMYIFDSLIYNDDRNQENILYTVGDCRLWMIDHTRSFLVKLKIPKYIKPETLRMSEEFADKLRQLKLSVLKQKLGNYVLERQLRYLLRRRDMVLQIWEDNGKPEVNL